MSPRRFLARPGRPLHVALAWAALAAGDPSRGSGNSGVEVGSRVATATVGETATSTTGDRPPPSYHPQPDAPIPPDAERRSRPDYDGRPPRPPTPGEVALWVPRVVFSPVYLVTEYAIRRPVGFLVTEIEKARAWDVLIDFFTFRDRRVGVIPTFFVQFDLRSSIGVYAFWNDFGASGNDVRLNFSFGGERWWLVSVRDRYRFDEQTEGEIGFLFSQRPDQIFAGTGSTIEVENGSRFLQRQIAARLQLRRRVWRQSELRWSARLGNHRFDGSRGGFDDPALDDAVRLGFFAPPAGLDEGFTVLAQRVSAVVDSRRNELRASATGIRAETYFELATDLERPSRSQWMSFGGVLSGFLDTGDNHTLGLTTRIDSQTALEERAIPFAELARPGDGPFEMSGFTPGLLRGESSFVTTFEYRYPIWVLVDGSVHVSAGNVFGPSLDGFAVERLRMSFGLGMRSSDRDNPLTVLLAFGTQTFQRGVGLESVRMAFGTGF